MYSSVQYRTIVYTIIQFSRVLYIIVQFSLFMNLKIKGGGKGMLEGAGGDVMRVEYNNNVRVQV